MDGDGAVDRINGDTGSRTSMNNVTVMGLQYIYNCIYLYYYWLIPYIVGLGEYIHLQ